MVLLSIGKTATQVDSVINTVKDQSRGIPSDVSGKIQALQDLQAKSTASIRTLNAIQVYDSKYHWKSNGFSLEPLISFSISNYTAIPIRRIFLDAVLSSPGRTVPWVKESFNYEFPGGLEPGEVQYLNLDPGYSGNWRHQDLKTVKDALLTLTVRDAEDADGQRIRVEFSEDDQKRLNVLLADKLGIQ
jgi:hypothetical protein